VLIAMLWKFHNSRTGYCFPSYETIAAAASCCRDTVYEASGRSKRPAKLRFVQTNAATISWAFAGL
jgi:hypothetical protein